MSFNKLTYALSGYLLILLVSGCATAGRDVGGIGNFAKVQGAAKPIYRGDQPSETGIAQLNQMGVKTVIDLCENPQDWESGAAKASGMTYVNISMSTLTAETEKLSEFLTVVRSSDGPFFVHCYKGRDRTGLVIAIYRIVDQGWDRESAIRELHDYGYQSLLLPWIEKYLRNFRPEDVKPSGQASR